MHIILTFLIDFNFFAYGTYHYIGSYIPAPGFEPTCQMSFLSLVCQNIEFSPFDHI